nr:BLUF domain-containing protein [Pedobacter kyonggii]
MELENEILTPVFYLIYTSIASRLFNNEELKALLNQCRNFNNRNNITGILLYVRGLQITKSKGRFMHLLEGDERIIRRLFNKIVNDERHESVVLLQIGKYEQRFFTDWSMGFEQTDGELYQSLSGYFDLNGIGEKCDKLGVTDVPLQFLRKLSSNNKKQLAEALYG